MYLKVRGMSPKVQYWCKGCNAEKAKLHAAMGSTFVRMTHEEALVYDVLSQ